MDIIDYDTWGEPWQSFNDSFEEMLKNDKDCKKLVGRCFMSRRVTT